MVVSVAPLLPMILEDCHGNTYPFTVARLIASPPAVPGVFAFAAPSPPHAAMQGEGAELVSFFGRRPLGRCTVVFVGETGDLGREHRAMGDVALAERLGATMLLLLFLPEAPEETRRSIADGLIRRHQPALNLKRRDALVEQVMRSRFRRPDPVED